MGPSTDDLEDHSNHGKGDQDGPYDCDCACRSTSREIYCYLAGCGFCFASLQMKKSHHRIGKS